MATENLGFGFGFSPPQVPPVGTLNDWLLRHWNEKVTNKLCPCCSTAHWDIIRSSNDPNEHMLMQESIPDQQGNRASFPMAAAVCRNCYHVRWFAVQPLITAWLAAGGKWTHNVSL